VKSVRLLRIEDELVRAVTGILRKLKDPRIGMVTVTGSEISPDLRNARIYVSVFGDESERKATLAALSHANAFVRRELGKGMRIRVTPEVRFQYDDSAERGERMDGLLKDLNSDT
jgi:ribosome-binding factor A